MMFPMIFISRFIPVHKVPYELFLTFRAGNADLSFSSGDADLLMTSGAVKIAVFPVTDSLEKHQILPVFLIALVGVPGQATKDCPTHKRIGRKHQEKIHRGDADKHIDKANCKAYTQNDHVQFVSTVTPLHKMTNSRSHPAEKSSHTITFR